jgi:hypothetical protein
MVSFEPSNHVETEESYNGKLGKVVRIEAMRIASLSEAELNSSLIIIRGKSQGDRKLFRALLTFMKN